METVVVPMHGAFYRYESGEETSYWNVSSASSTDHATVNCRKLSLLLQRKVCFPVMMDLGSMRVNDSVIKIFNRRF
jgi:hypothetical protein